METTKVWTCSACATNFIDSNQHRLHYQSDWHRYNLKRRIAQLPMLSEPDFVEKQRLYSQKIDASAEKKPLRSNRSPQDIKDSEQADIVFGSMLATSSGSRVPEHSDMERQESKHEWHCKLCNKHFASENSHANHLRSSKHRLAMNREQGPEYESQQLVPIGHGQDHQTKLACPDRNSPISTVDRVRALAPKTRPFTLHSQKTTKNLPSSEKTLRAKLTSESLQTSKAINEPDTHDPSHTPTAMLNSSLLADLKSEVLAVASTNSQTDIQSVPDALESDSKAVDEDDSDQWEDCDDEDEEEEEKTEDHPLPPVKQFSTHVPTRGQKLDQLRKPNKSRFPTTSFQKEVQFERNALEKSNESNQRNSPALKNSLTKSSAAAIPESKPKPQKLETQEAGKNEELLGEERLRECLFCLVRHAPTARKDKPQLEQGGDQSVPSGVKTKVGQGAQARPRRFTSLNANLVHMDRVHLFAIPDAEFCTDKEGLVAFLAEKVHEYHECLWCGRSYTSTHAVRQHMLALGHTHMRFDVPRESSANSFQFRVLSKIVEEYLEFYDYSSSYPDQNAEGDNGSESESESDGLAEKEGKLSSNRAPSDGDSDALVCPAAENEWARALREEDVYELVLPGGRHLGHRSLRRFWRQRVPLQRSGLTDPILKARMRAFRRFLAAYRAMGLIYDSPGTQATQSAMVGTSRSLALRTEATRQLQALNTGRIGALATSMGFHSLQSGVQLWRRAQQQQQQRAARQNFRTGLANNLQKRFKQQYTLF